MRPPPAFAVACLRRGPLFQFDSVTKEVKRTFAGVPVLFLGEVPVFLGVSPVGQGLTLSWIEYWLAEGAIKIA